MHDGVAFKILLPDEQERLEGSGRFDGSPTDLMSGFIHLSTAAQLEGTLSKHFADTDDLYFAAVDLRGAGERIRWERANNGHLYPHLYGGLCAGDIIARGRLEREPDGMVRLPAPFAQTS